MKQKYLLLAFSSLALVLYLVSCKETKQPETQEEEPIYVYDFSSQDSLAITTLAEQYVSLYNQGNMEAVADMLYTLRNDSIFPLTQEEHDQFMMSLKGVPTVGCELKDIELRTERDNKVKIAIKLNEDANVATGEGTITYVLNPVMVEGQWYLTMYDPYADGVGVFHKN